MEQTLAGLAPLRGAAARGLAPQRGAAARGRLALAYCFPPIPQKSGMDGARSFMRCEMEIAAARMNFGDVVSQELPRRHQGDTQAAQN